MGGAAAFYMQRPLSPGRPCYQRHAALATTDGCTLTDQDEIRRWIVKGAVQGVGFRMFVHRKATELGLRGRVRNTGDGGVDVVAAGQLEQLDLLENDLRQGPAGSAVRSVDRQPAETDADSLGSGFMIVP